MSRIGQSGAALRNLSLCIALAAAASSAALAQAPPAAADDFIYHAQAHDTLIGLGRRLLLEPKRWRDVQTRNHIADPRRIPRGSVLRIPYEWLRTSIETASVAALSGTVQMKGGTVTQGEALPQGSVVETGTDGSVTIALADGSVVTLQKSSVLTLDQMARVTGLDAAHSIRLKLGSGRLETVVKPNRDVGRFEIVTPVAVAAVRGTRFRDSFSSDGDAGTTETLEGTVGVSGGAASVPIAAGFGTRVERDRPPLPPVALLPPPDLSGVPAINSGAVLRVEFGPAPGAHAHRVQISTDSEFHAIVADTLTTAEVATLSGLPDGEYWVRARAIDALGIEGMDAVRRVTQHVLPEPPVPVAPAAGIKVTGTHAWFTWTAAGPGLRYTLQVARGPDFSAPVIERSGLDATSAEADDMPPGQYFWRVASINARDEAGQWSEVQTYVQRAAMPMPDVPRQAAKRLQLSWQAIPGQSYRLQVAHDADFERIVLDRRVDAAEWSMPKPFPGTYFVRVQVIDADGDAGPFGPARRFEIPVPLWVKIVSPLVLFLSLIR